MKLKKAVVFMYITLRAEHAAKLTTLIVLVTFLGFEETLIYICCMLSCYVYFLGASKNYFC